MRRARILSRRGLAGLLLLAGLGACPRLAAAYCAPETSPCYRWDRYSALGGFFCRHWHFGAFDSNYLIGLAPGISPAQYLTTVRDAKDAWEAASTSSLPDFSYTVNSPADTTGVSYWLWVDDATWTARQFNPNAAGLTYRRVDGLGVVVHARTWLHLRPTNWRWSPDCAAENCAGDAVTKPGLDFPSIVRHEFGHWWVLLDISAGGCEHVMMWGTISPNSVRRTIQFPDAIGAVFLYDQPVGTATALLSADAVSDRVNLEWLAAEGAGSAHDVERRESAGGWTRKATVTADGEGRVRWSDVEVVSGNRYVYRLCARGGGACSAESSIEVPIRTLAVEPLSGGNGALDIRMTLPSSAPASLELFDVVGRKLRQFDMGTYGPGDHVIRLASKGELPAGLVWLRLRQGTRAATHVARVLP